MRRIILVLTVTAMMLATSLALPALAAAEMGTKGGEEEPGNPECDWYGPFEEGNWDPWWEYWCYWPGWGWEYVFWSY